jgi:hypothetical protein
MSEPKGVTVSITKLTAYLDKIVATAKAAQADLEAAKKAKEHEGGFIQKVWKSLSPDRS